MSVILPSSEPAIQIIEAVTPVQIAIARKIRREVFTLEQNIPGEVDNDGKDEEAIHLLLYESDEAAATGRLVIEQDIAYIARIAVLPEFRGKGYGREIVMELEKIARIGTIRQIALYPHVFLENFYRNLGFETDVSYSSEVAGYALIRMYKKIE